MDTADRHHAAQGAVPQPRRRALARRVRAACGCGSYVERGRAGGAGARAVVTGQQGSFVFVVEPDGTARHAPGHGRAHRGRPGGRSRGGVEPGERVVTDGQLRLHQGRQGRRSSPERHRPGGGGAVNISALFIRRPVMTTLVMVGILLFGLVAYRQLPVSDLPNVDYPDHLGERRACRARAPRRWRPRWRRRSRSSSRPSPASTR